MLPLPPPPRNVWSKLAESFGRSMNVLVLVRAWTFLHALFKKFCKLGLKDWIMKFAVWMAAISLFWRPKLFDRPGFVGLYSLDFLWTESVTLNFNKTWVADMMMNLLVSCNLAVTESSFFLCVNLNPKFTKPQQGASCRFDDEFSWELQMWLSQNPPSFYV
jgi:hypothetical protein